MDLKFEYGDPAKPRGHALIYYDTGTEVKASYVVVLPLRLDIQRYVPPFLASQLGNVEPDDMSLIVIPPVPESFGSLEQLLELARRRGDDVIYAGAATGSESLSSMGKTNELARAYMALCHDGGVVLDADDDDDDVIDSVDAAAEAVAKLIMSDGDDSGAKRKRKAADDAADYAERKVEDNLQEVAVLLGQLRYAVEGRDANQIDAISRKIRAIGKVMPPRHQIDKLVRFGSNLSPEAGQLAQLYLERAFSMQREDYLMVKRLDERIANLDLGPSGEAGDQ